MTKFSELTQQLLEKANGLDDAIDNSLFDVKDITDTASDLIKPIKVMVSIYQYAKKKKFKAFLKTYATAINQAQLTDKGKISIEKYLREEQNLDFINSIIENALHSKSTYCSSILGYYAGSLLIDGSDINYKSIITIETLKNLYDIELEMFLRIFNTANLAKPVRVKDIEELKPYTGLCIKASEKLKSLGLLDGTSSGGHGPISGYGTFISTDIAEDLWLLIKDMKREEEILANK